MEQLIWQLNCHLEKYKSESQMKYLNNMQKIKVSQIWNT